MSPNEGRQWQNLLGCDNWVLSGSPEPTMVGFRNLIRVGIGPVSKKLAVNIIPPFNSAHLVQLLNARLHEF